MREILKRKQNETLEQYQIRLSLGLLNRELGYEDLTWKEIKDMLSSDMHPDTLRRLGYGFKLYESNFPKVLRAEEELDELDEKIVEMKKEKVKLTDVRTSVNRKIRELGRVENIIEEIARNLDELNENNPLINKEIVPVINNSRQGLLLCSDWHCGAEFKTVANSFNLDILVNRVNEMVDRTIEICKRNNIEKIHIGYIGDLCNGLIHTTTRIENQIGVAEQVTLISELISQMLDKLSKNFSVVSMSMTSSNHERFFMDKRENSYGDSYHRFIFEIVKLRTRDLINVAILENTKDESFTTLDLCGERIVLSHGDKDKKVNVPSRYSQILGYTPTLVCMGHYHNEYSTVEGLSRIIINGSLMGSNQYAVDLRLCSTPSQSLIIMSEKYGYESTHIISFK